MSKSARGGRNGVWKALGSLLFAAIATQSLGSGATRSASVPSGVVQDNRNRTATAVIAPQEAGDRIMSVDFENTRAGVCSTLASRSPKFREFLRLNPAVGALGAQDQQQAWALAGARVALARLEFLNDPARKGELRLSASVGEAVDELLEEASDWLDDAEERWIEGYDGSTVADSTPATKNSSGDLAKESPAKAKAAQARQAIVKRGLVSPAKREVEILIDLLLAQYLLWTGESDVAAERAGLVRNQIVKDLPDSGLVMAADLVLVDASLAERSPELAVQYAELYDEDRKRFPQLNEKLGSADLKVAAIEAGGYSLLRKSGASLSAARDPAAARRKLASLYSGGRSSLFGLVLPGGAALFPARTDPDPETLYALFGPGSAGAAFGFAFSTLASLTAGSESIVPSSAGRPSSLAEQTRWTVECGELGARATLAGDLALASAAGQTAWGQLDAPMTQALASLGISEESDPFSILLDHAEKWYTKDRSPDDWEIAQAGLIVLGLPLISGDLEVFTKAARRAVSDDVFRHIWPEAREQLIGAEAIAEAGLSRQDADRIGEQMVRSAGGIRDVLLTVLEAWVNPKVDGEAYRDVDRASTELRKMVSVALSALEKVWRASIRRAESPEERDSIRSLMREARAAAGPTQIYVDNVMTNLEAILAARAGDERRFAAAAEKSRQQAKDLAAALGGRVTATDSAGIVRQATLISVNYGLGLAGRIASEFEESGEGLSAEGRSLVELGTAAALDVLFPSRSDDPREAKARGQRYRALIAQIKSRVSGQDASGEPSDWKQKLREYVAEIEWPETTRLGQRPIAAAARPDVPVFVRLQGALEDLRAANGEAERTFLLDGLEAVLQGAVSSIGIDIEPTLADISDDLYLGLVQIGFRHDRIAISEATLRLWDAAKRWQARTRRGGDAASDTGSFRGDRTAFALRAWVVTLRLMSGDTNPVLSDVLLQSLDFANRSSAGVDLSLQLEMASAPAKVKQAFDRWRRLSLDREADVSARRAKAREILSVTRLLFESFPASFRASAQEVSDSLRDLLIEAQSANYPLGEFRTPSFVELSSSLDINEVLVTGFAFDQELLMVAVKRGQPIRVSRVSRPYVDLTALSARLRASLTLQPRGSAPGFDSEASRQIYASLFAFADDLVDGSGRIVWSPPRGLDNFPIAALDRSQGTNFRWLGLEKEIMVAPSLASFARQRKAEALPRTGMMAAVGDVPFTGTTTGGLDASRPSGVSDARPRIGNLNSYLGATPAARGALTALAQRFPQIRLIAGANATLANVRAGLQDQTLDYLLFHTHGVGEDVTLACGYGVSQALALNQGDSQTCAGALLGAQDAAQLRIKARVVMLGACSTSAAPNQELDPLSGMARGFLLGGARAVISAHLPVSDDAASIVGRDLAIGLQVEKLTASAALKRAMANVRALPGRSGPAYWAQFELIGEGGR